MAKPVNNLAKETSPYLLQHAHNPVNWYPWGAEALQRAKQEDKPILVSIGYAACHWCHVMERESFEDAATAAIMNEHFVNIKIDREERPDLDHVYMDAVQAMTGSGGWPLNVFLTPDTRPFYGGTYFPPQPVYNRPSWKDTLLGVAKAFRERRNEIESQAENLTEHLVQSNSFGLTKNTADALFTREHVQEAANQLLKQADREWGGFGRPPKFPQTFSIQYLLRYHAATRDAEALAQALLSLDKMIQGGIYDQVGGGFSRYATDTEWLVPHFEKMLYDNALLVSVLSEAYQLTGKDRYREVIRETIDFLQREMLGEEGGFYAALDADSEGVEGKYYVWGMEEVRELLGGEAAVFSAYYDISEQGNWEHVNILRVKDPLAGEGDGKKADTSVLNAILSEGRKKLLERRNSRVRPLLDDKIILGWNALMNTALSKAFAATGEAEYRALALRNMRFLLEKFRAEADHPFYHTWKKGVAKFPAFLDDHAFLIEALVQLQEITGDTRWLWKAREITEYVQRAFREKGTGYFFYTPSGQADILVRKKEVYDGAQPSGNSVMAANLHRLGILFGIPEWVQQAREMVTDLGKAIVRYPGSFGNWACLMGELTEGTAEIAVTGPGYQELQEEILRKYIPCKVLMGGDQEEAGFPLLLSRAGVSRTTIFLCRNYTCERPVFSAEELMLLINKGEKR